MLCLLTVRGGVEGLCLPVAEQPKLHALDTNNILSVWSSIFGNCFIKEGNEETQGKTDGDLIPSHLLTRTQVRFSVRLEDASHFRCLEIKEAEEH